MPWRRTREPYPVWLSEMMLQQTQVVTALPYYQRFIKRFPTVQRLAAAPLDEVLLLWSGLGYYARARNMHRAACMIVNEFGGQFPDTVEGLRLLPGIGPYSAGAIASICFDRRAAVVDGNVIRVLSRVFNIHDDTGKSQTVKRIWTIAEALTPKARCGDYNQALMELGATICVPGAAARCTMCPLKSICGAFKKGCVADLPRKPRKAVVRSETHVVAAIYNRDHWLVRRRPSDGLWGGLWEMPSEVLVGRSTKKTAERLTTSLTKQATTVAARPFCDVTHQLSHRTIRFVGHVCTSARRSPSGNSTHWAMLDEIMQLGLSRAMRLIIEDLSRMKRNGKCVTRRRRASSAAQ